MVPSPRGLDRVSCLHGENLESHVSFCSSWDLLHCQNGTDLPSPGGQRERERETVVGELHRESIGLCESERSRYRQIHRSRQTHHEVVIYDWPCRAAVRIEHLAARTRQAHVTIIYMVIQSWDYRKFSGGRPRIKDGSQHGDTFWCNYQRLSQSTL